MQSPGQLETHKPTGFCRTAHQVQAIQPHEQQLAPHFDITFRHTPDDTIQGIRRWPGTFEPQARPHSHTCHFYDIFPHVIPYLHTTERHTLCRAGRCYKAGPYTAPLWLTKPWQPLQRRRWGYGSASRTRGCIYDKVNPISVIHYIWTFLTWQDRVWTTRVCTTWQQYGQLRYRTATTPINQLRKLRHGEAPKTLDAHRAALHTYALLRFEFIYGDLPRWMNGEYTNRSRKWTAEWRYNLTQIVRPLPDDYPRPDYQRTFKADTQGDPLVGNFCTLMEEAMNRNAYDNHPAVASNLQAVHEKFAKEEHRAYHIHFQRAIVPFLHGLIINPIQWAYDKGKGRICIDCTNGPNPEGSANTYIPGPKDKIPYETPPVYYQYAMATFLSRLYKMRQSKPETPILVHADDVDAAFRHILYHPDMAIAFAYIFDAYLIVPIGQVFGSRNAPSWCCLKADARQALAATLNLATNPADFHRERLPTFLFRFRETFRQRFNLCSRYVIDRSPYSSENLWTASRTFCCPARRSTAHKRLRSSLFEALPLRG